MVGNFTREAQLKANTHTIRNQHNRMMALDALLSEKQKLDANRGGALLSDSLTV
jgi:hypothetical protein